MPDLSDFYPKLKHKLLTAEMAIADVGYRGDPKVMTPDEYRKDKSNHIIKDIVKFLAHHKQINDCFKT